MGFLLGQAKPEPRPTGWKQVRAVFENDVSRAIPTAVLLLLLVGVILIVAFSRSPSGGAVAAQRQLVWDRTVETVQHLALVAAAFFAFTIVLGVKRIDWQAIVCWALLAAAMIEIPKGLNAAGFSALARRLGTGLAVVFAVPVAVRLTRGTFSLDWWPFAGVVLGALLSFGLLGPRSVVSRWFAPGAAGE